MLKFLVILFRDHTFMISKKNVQFLHPSPPFLSVPMGPNWAGPPTSACQNLGYQPLPTPIPFGIFPKNWNAKIKLRCCLQLSFLQNQTPVCLEHLQQNQTPVWNTYSRTRHQSGTLIAEPDTCLVYCLDFNKIYNNYSSGYPISVDPLPSPPLPLITIHFRLNFSYFLPDPHSPPSTGCHKCMVPYKNELFYQKVRLLQQFIQNITISKQQDGETSIILIINGCCQKNEQIHHHQN